jgi:Fe-Mn family superoxide dismutase
MHTYQEQKFNLPDLKGISPKQLEIHLGLYGGYVKHVNTLREKVHELEDADKEGNAYVVAELRRRLGFEFDGMRMHEYYFEQWEREAVASSPDSPLSKALAEKYGDWNGFLDHFKTIGGGTRGIGWTILYWDPKGNTPHTTWIGDHELGQLSGLPVLLAMDMWEHAYMVDYTPVEKKQYIEAFLENLNWDVVENRFTKAAR